MQLPIHIVRILMLAILVGESSIALSGELRGSVCLGENRAISLSEHSDRLYIRIGNSQKIYFQKNYSTYSTPKIVLDNLDVSVNYSVKIYFDYKLVKSWVLNFSKLETDTVLIWRAKGSWRMEPIEMAICKKNP